jgi:hypothetical protein
MSIYGIAANCVAFVSQFASVIGRAESCHLVVIWRGEMATGEMAKMQVFWGVGC